MISFREQLKAETYTVDEYYYKLLEDRKSLIERKEQLIEERTTAVYDLEILRKKCEKLGSVPRREFDTIDKKITSIKEEDKIIDKKLELIEYKLKLFDEILDEVEPLLREKVRLNDIHIELLEQRNELINANRMTPEIYEEINQKLDIVTKETEAIEQQLEAIKEKVRLFVTE